MFLRISGHLMVVLLLVWGLSSHAQAQCSGGTLAGSITPTTTFQTIACVNAGQYYTFNATAGATYTFSFCQGGGSFPFTFDTYLTILDNSGTPVAAGFNDNTCFPTGAEVVWAAPSTATYRIRISLPAPGCGSNAICATLAYRMTNPPGPGVNCSNPMVIAAIPYTNSGLTTCGNGNTYTSAHACGSTYMNGEDFIFRYNSPGNECINIALTGTTSWVGVFVYNGCPNTVGTTCVAQATSGAGNPSVSGVQLTAAGNYYILVSTLPPPACTPFNINITRCPTGTTCGYARNITSLPYSQSGLTTCGFGNEYTSANACASSYMNGEDFIFSYTTASPICLDLFTTNTSGWTGLFVYNGCPSTVGTTCIAQNTSIYGNPTLTGVNLPAAGTYYFMVDTRPMPNCTPFNIVVDTCRPAVPCGTNPPPTNACPGATDITNYTTFCGTTDTTVYNADGPGNLPSTFCGTIENNGWFSFVADTSVVHFFFTVTNCYHGNGIQAQVMSTSNCSTFTSVSNCFNPMTQSNGTLTASGLVVGQTYYLMVDGYAEDDCDYVVSWDGGPLPVEFGPIQAFVVDGKVNVAWETYSESNCERFVLERGIADLDGEVGGIDWVPAGTVGGHGTTTASHQYHLEDETPLQPGTYYRIRETDFDGFSSYSQILEVQPSLGPGNELLEIYPNPAKDRLNLSIGIGSTAEVSLRLYDLSGKLVETRHFGQLGVGNHAFGLDLPLLPTGVYLYDIQLGKDRHRGKLMIAQ